MDQTGKPNTSSCPKAVLDPDRCHFYLQKKRRYCRTIPPNVNEHKYCVEHSHLLGDSTRKRITCPLDPKHTCYEDQLKKHLKKCNARDDIHPGYFIKNINLSDDGNEVIEDPTIKVTVRSVETAEILKMLEKVKQLYEEFVDKLETEILFHEALQEETDKPSNGQAAQKHLQQQASLVGHIKKEGFLEGGAAFVEFGAGKGGLSHWVQRATANSQDNQFLLVEKGGIRYKMDNYHKGDSQGPKFERLRIDIQHLHLGCVKSLHETKKPIIGIGKHLCGGATDLMLRCLLNTTNKDRIACKENNAKAKKIESSGPVEGIVLAMCCHHRCDWQSYVGKQFMTEVCGLNGRDFHLLSSMTSWATCATPSYSQRETPEILSQQNKEGITDEVRNEDAAEQQQQQAEDEHHHTDNDNQDYSHPRYGNLSPEEREKVGYMCKRLIDMGRAKYLKLNNYKARLVHYIDKKYSLEDVALLAKPVNP